MYTKFNFPEYEPIEIWGEAVAAAAVASQFPEDKLVPPIERKRPLFEKLVSNSIKNIVMQMDEREE